MKRSCEATSTSCRPSEVEAWTASVPGLLAPLAAVVGPAAPFLGFTAELLSGVAVRLSFFRANRVSWLASKPVRGKREHAAISNAKVWIHVKRVMTMQQSAKKTKVNQITCSLNTICPVHIAVPIIFLHILLTIIVISSCCSCGVDSK